MIIDNEIFVVSPKVFFLDFPSRQYLIHVSSLFKKVGYLAPGESAHICLSYKHDLAGSHKLPVLFKLKSGGSGNLQTSRNEDAQAQVEVDRGTTASSGQTVLRDGGGGKEILINFIGYSAPSKKKYLHFHSSEHVFAGISIGSEQPPIQMYPLYNNGCVPLEYSIDVSPLINVRGRGKRRSQQWR